MARSVKTWVEGVVNLAIVLAVALPVAILWFGVDPPNRGFYCDDESIAYPLRENTISNAVLCVICIGVPIAMICCIEWFFSASNIINSNNEKAKKMYFTIVNHLFGVAVTVLLTIVAIYSIGRLRYIFI